MINQDHVRTEVIKLFASQRLGVLATYGSGQPYSSLVAFAASDDLNNLLFATIRSTRKHDNLTRNSHVSMLVDNRSNQDSDFHDAIAVTATGEAQEVEKHEREALLKIYLDKHPYLRDFVMSSTCALMKITVQRFYLVHSFQQVLELPLTTHE